MPISEERQNGFHIFGNVIAKSSCLNLAFTRESYKRLKKSLFLQENTPYAALLGAFTIVLVDKDYVLNYLHRLSHCEYFNDIALIIYEPPGRLLSKFNRSFPNAAPIYSQRNASKVLASDVGYPVSFEDLRFDLAVRSLEVALDPHMEVRVNRSIRYPERNVMSRDQLRRRLAYTQTVMSMDYW